MLFYIICGVSVYIKNIIINKIRNNNEGFRSIII